MLTSLGVADIGNARFTRSRPTALKSNATLARIGAPGSERADHQILVHGRTDGAPGSKLLPKRQSIAPKACQA
jgi:hypothetical protein